MLVWLDGSALIGILDEASASVSIEGLVESALSGSSNTLASEWVTTLGTGLSSFSLFFIRA
jgi:hypothetical protein